MLPDRSLAIQSTFHLTIPIYGRLNEKWLSKEKVSTLPYISKLNPPFHTRITSNRDKFNYIKRKKGSKQSIFYKQESTPRHTWSM